MKIIDNVNQLGTHFKSKIEHARMLIGSLGNKAERNGVKYGVVDSHHSLPNPVGV